MTREAEKIIIRWLQESEYGDEISALQGKGSITRKSKLFDLSPYLDEDGLLRVGGRIKRSSYLDDVKNPIIIPGSSHIAKIIIRKFHEDIYHQGRGMTMNEVRSNGYWITGASKIVSTLIHKCVACRRFRSKPMEQRMADLPKERLEVTAPFTHVGLDCFGPIVVQEGRRELKRYGLIVTCLASRAVHIELLDDLTTDSFINGLRNLISIRGHVSSVLSDQGSNFIGAHRELKKALQEITDPGLKKYMEDNQIQFKTNSPHSSHMGGVWERQIRSIRNILAGMMEQHSKRLNTSTLRTFLYEAMSILNSRPLTPQNLSDPELEPLTPNHLIMMKGKMILDVPGQFKVEDVYARKRWRQAQYLAQEFWSRWQKEYLLTQQRRQKWNKVKMNLEEGDIVLVKEDAKPRGEWIMARVEKCLKDQDGLVRRVQLVMGKSTGDNSLRKLERPIHKLVLLLKA